MTRIQLTAADLAQLRFTTSAVWETVAGVQSIGDPVARAVHTPLRAPPGAEERRALRLLSTLGQVSGWLPNLLAPVPRREEQDIPDFVQLESVPVAVLHGDLAVFTSQHIAPWSGTEPELYLRAVGRALRTIWDARVAPQWDTLRQVYAADLARRAALTAHYGLTAVLNSLHADVSFHGEELDVRVNSCSRTIAAGGRGIVLVPSVFRASRVMLSLDMPGPIVLGYPALGAAQTWERPPGGDSDPISRLLGSTRGQLIRDLEQPATTTALARRHGLARSTVSEHLGALVDNGLASSTREGKRVLYSLTQLGTALLQTRTPSPRRRS